MKKQFYSFLICAAVVMLSTTACEDDETVNPFEPIDTERWITVAGAKMGTDPGDGNGGTMVYAVAYEDVKNPEYTISVYDDGFPVKSQRTARLQSSQDGNTLFNIQYTGANGGEFNRYKVNGADNFVQEEATVNIAQYATASPRWAKLFDGDKTGIAVNVTAIAANNATDPEATFQYYRGIATVLALDLEDVLIKNYEQFEIPLSEAEELAGHTLFRLDAPVLNQAGDKLLIGTWMRKYNPATGEVETEFERLGTKMLIVDYPSLKNPTLITSTVGHGDCSGYRSFNSFLAEDGSIYQATQRDPNGSHILKITKNNQYDNSYLFSLDEALGVNNVYVDSWRYAGNGIAYALYTHDAANNQGFVARLDLNAKTAELVEGIEYDAALDFGQYQGILVNGEEVFIAVTPVGKDGNIYILNSRTGGVTKGAKLINKAGNHYIGIF